MQLHERLCLTCSKPYMSRNNRQKYCSYKCYIDTLNLTSIKRRAAVEKYQSKTDGVNLARKVNRIMNRRRGKTNE